MLIAPVMPTTKSQAINDDADEIVPVQPVKSLRASSSERAEVEATHEWAVDYRT